SLINMTPCPMNTSSSMITPSQIKEWLETLQLRPTEAFFWISTNAPILVLSPTEQPYMFINFDSLTFSPRRTSGAIERKVSVKGTSGCSVVDNDCQPAA